jgi:hypothetical protein
LVPAPALSVHDLLVE